MLELGWSIFIVAGFELLFLNIMIVATINRFQYLNLVLETYFKGLLKLKQL